MDGLKPRDVTFTVVSAMVGAGIFLAPGRLLANGATPQTILWLFAGVGIVAIAGGLTLSELASRHPGNGGPYRYIRQELGRMPGFAFNWSRFWIMQTGALAVLSLACVRFVARAMEVKDPFWEAVAAIGLLAASAALNARGLRIGARVQAALTLLKVGALLALVIGVLVAGRPDGLTDPPPATTSSGIGGWLLLAIFAYGGWTQVTFLAGETKQPSRLARFLVLGIVVATALYLAATAAMLAVLPDGTTSDVIAAEAASALWGSEASRWVALLIATAILGGLHTMTLTGPRLYEAAANRGDWWHPFARRNAHGAPGRSIWLQAEWAALLVALSLLSANAFDTLIGGLGAAIWMFHILTALAWFKGRRKPAAFRTPGGRLTAGLFLAATITVVALAIWQDVQRIADGRLDELQATWALVAIGTGLVAAVGTSDRRTSAWRGKPQEPSSLP